MSQDLFNSFHYQMQPPHPDAIFLTEMGRSLSNSKEMGSRAEDDQKSDIRSEPESSHTSRSKYTIHTYSSDGLLANMVRRPCPPAKKRPTAPRGNQTQKGVGTKRQLVPSRTTSNKDLKCKSSITGAFSNVVRILQNYEPQQQKKISISSKSIIAKQWPPFKDTETMYEEMQQLKVALHTLQQEKRILTGKLHMCERENSRLEKKYEDLATSSSLSYPRMMFSEKGDEGFVKSLKMTLKQKQREFSIIENKLATLQLSLKHTKVMEMEIEMRTYFQEILRLRRLVEHKRQGAPVIPDEASRQVLEYEKLIGDFKRERTYLNEKNLEFERTQEELKQEKIQLEDKLFQLEQDFENLNDQYSEAIDNKAALEADFQLKLKEQRDQKNELEKELVMMQQALRKMDDEHNDIMAVKKREFEDLHREKIFAEETIKELRKSESDMLKELKDRQEKINELLKNKQDMMNQIENQQKRVSSLTENLENQQIEIEGLKAKDEFSSKMIQQLKSHEEILMQREERLLEECKKATDLRAQNLELSQQLTQFKSIVQTLEENVTAFTSRESKVARELEDYKLKDEEKEKAIASLKNDIEHYQSSIVCFETEDSKSKVEIQSLKEEIIALEQKMIEKDSGALNLSDQIHQLQQNNDFLSKEIDDLKIYSEQGREEIQQLNRELEVKSAEGIKLKDHCNELTRKCEELQNDNETERNERRKLSEKLLLATQLSNMTKSEKETQSMADVFRHYQLVSTILESYCKKNNDAITILSSEFTSKSNCIESRIALLQSQLSGRTRKKLLYSQSATKSSLTSFFNDNEGDILDQSQDALEERSSHSASLSPAGDNETGDSSTAPSGKDIYKEKDLVESEISVKSNNVSNRLEELKEEMESNEEEEEIETYQDNDDFGFQENDIEHGSYIDIAAMDS